jgi:hypothetical protein
MTMPVIDSYPKFARDDEIQASGELETLDVTVQQPAEGSLAVL